MKHNNSPSSFTAELRCELNCLYVAKRLHMYDICLPRGTE